MVNTKTNLVGVPGGWPNSMFSDFWGRLATHYKSNPKVIFGLMNEPIGGGMTPPHGAHPHKQLSMEFASNRCFKLGSWCLRQTGCTLSTSFKKCISDDQHHRSGNNWSYDMHQYFDYDGSGTHTDTMSPANGVATLSAFTDVVPATQPALLS